MITSVSFTADGKEDYINDVLYKTVPKKGYTWDDVEKAKHAEGRRFYYWKDVLTKEVRVGYKNPTLRKCVMKRTFEFCPDKVNVLFGPNGSGKTTILRAIAGHCMCGQDENNLDGYTSLMKFARSFAFVDVVKKKDYAKVFSEVILKTKRNASEVVWDGAPVFYENMAGRINYGIAGDMVGGIIQNFKEEVAWTLNKNSTSAGQKTIMLLHKLVQIAENFMKPSDLIKEAEKASSKDDYFRERIKPALEYYKSQLSETPVRPTILLDEMDRSLDLLNVFSLYSNMLPALMKKFSVQIIIVSHSPIVLMDKIYGSEDYNVISMDNKYTKECLKTLKSLI
jgi:predicted ATPase